MSEFKNKIKAVSLFSNVGIAETYFNEVGVSVAVANELIDVRAKFYKHLNPGVEMIVGDITDDAVFNKVIDSAIESKVEMLIATPPCQGMSCAGRKDPKDPRNFLVYYAVEAVKKIKPKFVIIENVPMQQHTQILYNDEYIFIPDYIEKELGDEYVINKNRIVNTMDYGVPQSRQRYIDSIENKRLYDYLTMYSVNARNILENQMVRLPSNIHIVDGDRFVGIKADSDNAMVYFPIGYELPETDSEIRTDIKHLIQVLSEFTTKDDRLLAINKFAAPQTVDFPINAYKSVIEYYFSIGGTYYVEKEQVYITAPTGKQDWARTARKQMPLVQSRNGVSSFVFTQFEVRSSTPNDTKEITQINRFCVYEAFKRLGWLYVPYMPEEPGPHPDVKTSIRIVQSKLAATNDDKKKSLFRGMKDMLV